VKDSAFTLCPMLSSTDYRLLTSGFFDLGLRLAKREGEFVFRTLTFRAGSQFQLQIFSFYKLTKNFSMKSIEQAHLDHM
jgi:hypothetical protein